MALTYEPMMIRDLPKEERPRERLTQLGASSLSNAELVAILLRTGTKAESAVSLAQRILAECSGLRGLASADYRDLVRVHGVGVAKALQIIAGIELGRRIFRIIPEERVGVCSPQDAADYVMDELSCLSQEHFVCLFLNTKNRVIDKQCLFVGTLNSSVVHPREVFREAIRRSCAAIICLHNHPSGDPTPSKEDILVTERLYEVGRIVGIELLDHIIIGDQCFVSLKEKGFFPRL
ncbi:DNA replication and repair protein RadC [Marininema mesophilum]|uniref:DNA replication and repair protein RadC n=1 Tax=Marininema mesophilum TaxID=1048340 RepID=A0A1H2S3F6_9BACL|nr:DNA repair protein RadC [Marininema mesophilum]SDW26040.1 DNA replication and repair protein RadC [Marininema mesophilum]